MQFVLNSMATIFQATPRCAFLAALLAGLCAISCSSPAQKEARFLKRGKSLLEKHNYAAASLEFQNAARVMPRDAEPEYEIGLAAMGVGDERSAATHFRKALELNPQHHDAQLRLASLMIATSDPKVIRSGAEQVSEVLAASPKDPDVLNLLAIAELRLGEEKDAISHLETALKNAPQDVAAAVNLSRVRLKSHDAAGAEAILKRLVEQSPKSATAALALAEFYLTVDREVDAAGLIERAYELDPKNATTLLLRASLQISHHQLDQAEKTYKDLSALDPQFRTLHAIFLYRSGKGNLGLAELEQLRKQYADDREVRKLLVAGYLRAGQSRKAETLIGEALKRNPHDVDALMQRSEFEKRTGKLALAQQDVEVVLRYNPKSAPAHFEFADVLALRGAEAESKQELAEVITLDPSVLPARIRLSKQLLRENHASSALKMLEDAPKAQRQDAEYIAARTRVLLALGRTSEARTALNGALRNSHAPDLLFQDGMLKILDKDFAAGRQSLLEVLQVRPEDVSALELIAISYLAEGQLPKALAFLTQSAGEHPNSSPIRTALGFWLARAGHREEARTNFLKAAEADPRAQTPKLALAELDYGEGRFENALRTLAPLISANPKDIRTLLLRGLLRVKTGNRTGAIEDFRAVLQLDSDNEDGLNDLAYVLTAENPDEALKYAQRAIELQPENGSALDTLGWIYYRKGMYRLAVENLRLAFAKQPAPTTQYHLGLAYARIGEEQLAAQNQYAALAKDPSLATGDAQPIEKQPAPNAR